MNEVLIRNEFTMDEALFTEGMKQVIRENYIRSARRLIAGLFILLGGLTIFTLLRDGTALYALPELAALLAAAFWALLYVPKRKVKKAWKAVEEQNGPEIKKNVTAGRTGLESGTGGSTIRVSYRDVRQILHSPNLLILIDGQKRGILLKRDAYLCGDEEMLLQLLGEARDGRQDEKDEE